VQNPESSAGIASSPGLPAAPVAVISPGGPGEHGSPCGPHSNQDAPGDAGSCSPWGTADQLEPRAPQAPQHRPSITTGFAAPCPSWLCPAGPGRQRPRPRAQEQGWLPSSTGLHTWLLRQTTAPVSSMLGSAPFPSARQHQPLSKAQAKAGERHRIWERPSPCLTHVLLPARGAG